MHAHLTTDDIVSYMKLTFGGDVKEGHNWGERGIFYNPGNLLPKGVYILTFKEKDGANDKASNTNRSGVYRLNLGVGRSAFLERFGEVPKRPSAGEIVLTGHDFTTLDTIMPHPVYGWMNWIGVLNPSPETFETLKPIIAVAVDLAAKKFATRQRQLRLRQGGD
ncbi:DUF6194 family protein [Litoreibacter albidus]|uniref:DUF6194 family protein n=1 Tax=Litoreibacter albidus TaxID=670155 RepID=UPI0037366F32